MQNSLFISRDLFLKYFKKPHEILFGEIKKRFPKIKIFFHSCGAIREIIPDLIETGIDILDPLQPLAAGMDSIGIKKDFGDAVVLHGGIDIQKALLGNREDVKAEVMKRIDAFAPGGGYILSPSNHIMKDVPVENFIDLYRFANKYGKYPLAQ